MLCVKMLVSIKAIGIPYSDILTLHVMELGLTQTP